MRGPNYLKDKKKVHPGPALCRLISLESFAVDASKDGDRHDHVCSRDAVQRRIEAVLSLRDPPFLFVMNFQVPGNPPVRFTHLLYSYTIDHIVNFPRIFYFYVKKGEYGVDLRSTATVRKRIRSR